MTAEQLEAAIAATAAYYGRECEARRRVFDSARPRLAIIVRPNGRPILRPEPVVPQFLIYRHWVDPALRIDCGAAIKQVFGLTLELSLNEVWNLIRELSGPVSKIAVHGELEQMIADGYLTADGSKPRLYMRATSERKAA